jgi:hypothetical protein
VDRTTAAEAIPTVANSPMTNSAGKRILLNMCPFLSVNDDHTVTDPPITTHQPSAKPRLDLSQVTLASHTARAQPNTRDQTTSEASAQFSRALLAAASAARSAETGSAHHKPAYARSGGWPHWVHALSRRPLVWTSRAFVALMIRPPVPAWCRRPLVLGRG